MNNLIWIEVSRKNLAHNARVMRNLVGEETLLAPTVKSNAYGHGMLGVAKILIESGADWLCVNAIDEAAVLRTNRIRKPIFLIGYTGRQELKGIIDLDLHTVIYDLRAAEILNNWAQKTGKQAKVFVKLDTGMGRQGITSSQLIGFVAALIKMKNINVVGLSTHFASSDEPERPAVFNRQKAALAKAIEDLGDQGIFLPYVTAANSAATLLYGNKLGNLVRPGKSIYGHYPSRSVEKICRQRGVILKPALALKTRVAQIKTVPKGAGISYGSTYIAKKPTRLAVLPVGYYDGYSRFLSNCAEVLIKGRRCRILGRVCMNMCMADVSEIKNARVEDEVVLIGKQGRERITVEELAEKIGTINYEVVTRLRESIPRFFV